ncbi:MAG: helical backbone metal receptor [Bacteroidota bacterium]
MSKRSKKTNLPVLLAATALLLAACSPATVVEPAATEAVEMSQPVEGQDVEDRPGEDATAVADVMTFTDDLGRTITLDGYPQRIVSTAPSLTEMLFAIGAGDRLVGRDDFSVYPEEAMAAPSFGSLFADFPAEAILAMEPDLVLAAQILSQDQVQAMEDLGLTVYWQANPTSFEELYANIDDLAALVGKAEEADALNADLAARVIVVLETIAAADTAPVVFYELDGTDPSNPWTAGAGTFVDLVITQAGGLNAAYALSGDFAQISVEALIEENPEYIVLGDSDFGMTPEIVAARGGWDVMLAVVAGNILPFDSNTLSVPGPRLVDGLEAMARIIHPELFE